MKIAEAWTLDGLLALLCRREVCPQKGMEISTLVYVQSVEGRGMVPLHGIELA